MFEPGRATTERFQIQPAHVRLDGLRRAASEVSPQLLDASRGVVRGLEKTTLAVGVLSKRHIDSDASGGRDDARLPKPAADRLAHPPPLPDDALGADEDAADRGAQALGEAQADGVEAGAELGQGAGAAGDDLPEARAVAVHADAVLARERRDAPHLRQRRDQAVEGVLEADDPRRADVDVVAQDDVLLDIFQRKVAAVARLDGRDEGPG